MEQEAPKTKRRLSLKTLTVLIVLILAIGGYAGAYYFYNQYKQTKIVLDNPEIASQKEVKAITEKLGKIYDLPKDDEPTVATVLDKEKLKDQPFFSKAENGDKVVIYTKSQLAILYRESANKIITIAPVSLSEPTGVETETSSPSPKPTSTASPETTE